MGVRFGLAKATGSVLTWGLRSVAHRDGANLPGKVAVRIDPLLISDLKPRLREGSIVVVGTNGKTTVNNLLANILERSGKSVICNRTGANMRHGIATALMQNKTSDWGVLECDELWLAKVLPQLQADYVLLLNLFRDQLDRCGEIEIIQDRIVTALEASPHSILIYNADDPLCAMIAERAAEIDARKNTRSIAFGTQESMGLAQNAVRDAEMCQRCSSMFEYTYRQYGQLGAYRCPNCGFKRPNLDFYATDIQLGVQGLTFTLHKHSENNASAASTDAGTSGGAETSPATDVDTSGGTEQTTCVGSIHAPFSGAYMVYNLIATATAATTIGCDWDTIQKSIDAYRPQNGRLQDYEVGSRHVLLNLAKNPTGFNQNLKIITQDKSPKAVAFFINDKEADGHDISWIWDIDFEELANDDDCIVFAGGIRKDDLRVRLKYADIPSTLINNMDDVFAELNRTDTLPSNASVYAIANYTALPTVKGSLDAMVKGADETQESNEAKNTDLPSDEAEAIFPDTAKKSDINTSVPTETLHSEQSGSPLVIAHLYPDLLNLYGDGGNVHILEQRCNWRHIPVEIKRVCFGDSINLADVDLAFLGGGPDREQKLACAQLTDMRDALTDFVGNDGVLLAICGGYQILGEKWLLGDEEVPGLNIVNFTTRRPGTSRERMINNIALSSPLSTHPVIGYENHAGRTYLGETVQCFGKVISSTGGGNNDTDKTDGVHYRNVIGTYSHGPLLSKNPEIADFLLEKALLRRSTRLKVEPLSLEKLDDTEELQANAFMCKKLGVSTTVQE